MIAKLSHARRRSGSVSSSAASKAMSQGGHLPKPFAYVDKGSLATIGRHAAVADIKGVRFSGTAAWFTWLFIHILFLVGLHNRLVVFMRWMLSFFTHGRAQRLITGESIAAEFERTAAALPAASAPAPPAA